MKAITNTQIIENRSKWAKRITPLTMIFLIGGLVTNFLSINQPQYFRLTLILLATGFIMATVSSYLVNRWVREPRADQVLTTTLKKFGNDYILFNYTTSPPHILLTPNRLYTLTVKPQDGQITANNKRFHRGFSWKRLWKVFAEEGLGSPLSEARDGAAKLDKQLRKNLSEEEIPEIEPLIIFSHKEVDLAVFDPVIPVMRINELKTYLREQTKSKAISATQRQALIKIIGGKWADR